MADCPYLFPVMLFLCAFPCISAVAQGQKDEISPAAVELRNLSDIPSVSGYEKPVTERIRAELASFHPVTDTLGDVTLTLGTGEPHRLITTPVDEPGFVVSAITDDGYLRLQRIPQSQLPSIFNELYSAQPVKIGVTNNRWIDGVVAGLSVHLQIGRVSSRIRATSRTCTSTSAQGRRTKRAVPESMC